MRSSKCEVLTKCPQSFPFKITYWGVVSVFKGSSIKFQYYIYKFKEFSRKRLISRSFQGRAVFPGVSRPVQTICYEYQFSLVLKLELITLTKISHLDSLWTRDYGELGNEFFIGPCIDGSNLNIINYLKCGKILSDHQKAFILQLKQ